jgi:hypothetical protein
MSTYTHVVSIKGLEEKDRDSHYTACINSLRRQTNQNFRISTEELPLDTSWLILTKVSGVLHPQFIHKVQGRFRHQPMVITTNGLLVRENKVYESICNETITIVGRTGELVDDNSDLPVEKINEYLFCEYNTVEGCEGEVMAFDYENADPWIKYE